MVLANAEHVEPNLVGQLDGFEQVAHALGRAQLGAGGGVGDHGSEIDGHSAAEVVGQHVLEGVAEIFRGERFAVRNSGASVVVEGVQPPTARTPVRSSTPTVAVVAVGCMAERYGSELAEALPEVDQVARFGVPITPPTVAPASTGRGKKLIPVSSAPIPSFDLLNLPRPRSERPWAYVKVAEGCDKACGFCAIPSFRGPQRSRPIEAVLDEHS